MFVNILRKYIRKAKSYKVLTTLLIMVALGVVFFCCRYGMNRRFHVTVPVSQDTLKVVFELLFEGFRDTEFDHLIGLKAGNMSYEDVVDRRQYREGYITTFKDGILNMPVDYLFDLLVRKDVNIGNYPPNVGYHRDYNPQNSSLFYRIGASRASEDLKLFRRQLWDDVGNTKWKYYNDDLETYFKYSEILPADVQKKRLEETPYLQAVIFLQDKLKNTPKISVEAEFPFLTNDHIE